MRESTLTSGCSDSPLACIIRHASYAEIAAAPCSVAVSYVRTTITRQLPLIKIASTEPVVRPRLQRERVLLVFRSFFTERLLNELLMPAIHDHCVSTTNSGNGASWLRYGSPTNFDTLVSPGTLLRIRSPSRE